MIMGSGGKQLAIGLEDFAEVRKSGCYYVEKTGLVTDLLRSSAKVTLLPVRADSARR